LQGIGYADCHIHSKYSFDSRTKVSDICKTAIERGLRAVTLTDHCEICVAGGKNKYWNYKNMKRSHDAARSAAKHYKGKLEIYAGIELGQPHHNPETAQKVLRQCDYDFVLASVHYLRDRRDFYYLDYITENDPYEVYSSYLDEVAEVVEMGCFDSLAHISYPLRYIIGRSGIDFEESRFFGKYDEILSALAEKGKALEINTAGGRNNPYMVPDVRLLSRFRELGGRYITLGSDAHRAFGVGGSMDKGAEMARAAGFDRVVYYSHHQPQEILI